MGSRNGAQLAMAVLENDVYSRTSVVGMTKAELLALSVQDREALCKRLRGFRGGGERTQALSAWLLVLTALELYKGGEAFWGEVDTVVSQISYGVIHRTVRAVCKERGIGSPRWLSRALRSEASRRKIIVARLTRGSFYHHRLGRWVDQLQIQRGSSLFVSPTGSNGHALRSGDLVALDPRRASFLSSRGPLKVFRAPFDQLGDREE